MKEKDLVELIKTVGKPVKVDYDEIEKLFGIKHLSSQELLLLKSIYPSKSDYELSTYSKYEIDEMIREMCDKNGFRFFNEINTNSYLFYATTSRP